MQERRAAERLRLDLHARWEALGTQGRGAVCDLSSLGCFVLASAEVTPGELIRLDVSFPDEIASLWGQVIYAVAEMGFALRFAYADDADRRALGELIDGVNRP